MNRAIRTANLFALVALLVIVVRPAGYLLDSRLVLAVGSATLISPLPMPFRDWGQYENYTQGRVYRFSFTDGEEQILEESHDLHKMIPGPHRYKIASVFPIDAGKNIAYEFREPVLEYLFCKKRFFLSDVSKVVSEVVVTQTDKRSGRVTDIIKHVCKNI